MRIVEQYLLKLNIEKRKLVRTAAILTALSCLVIVGVSWNLRITAITIANGATCGIQEHQHSEQCEGESMLICGYEQEIVPLSVEESELVEVVTEAAVEEEIAEEITEFSGEENGEIPDPQPSSTPEPKIEQHTHVEACYTLVNCCVLEEHIHDISCYADETVDIETSAIWEKTLPELTGQWAEDVVLIAQSQIGNVESEKNYMVAADGQERNGITRYGQWYGNPYGDWSAMFVLFCINYAEIPQQALPQSPGVDNMMHMAEEAQLVRHPDSNMEKAGNLLFADTDGNGKADRLLITVQYSDGILTAIGGDIENSVAKITVSAKDSAILGYIDVSALQTEFEGKEQESLPDSTESAEKTDEIDDSDLQQAEEEPEDAGIASEEMAPFNINKNNNNYVIDVYALPVDKNGNRIEEINLTTLNDLTINKTTKTEVQRSFNNSLGTYVSAYFGTENSVSTDNNSPLDNIKSVWRYETGSSWRKTYYLAYQKTDNTQNQQWLSNADTSISLYLRYIPNVTVTFQSEDFTSVSQKVEYGSVPTLTEPSQWEREDLTLIGWKVKDGGESVYTWEELMALPVTGNVTYIAQWALPVILTFDMGEYTDALYPIDPMSVPFSSTVQQLPTPQWRFNAVAMAFDGWYLNQELTLEAAADYQFKEDITLYAKWSPKDDGYYVYFMDFDRENGQELVLMTYGVTEGKTTASYIPANAPEGKEWDGKWYLDRERSVEYNFRIPVSQMTNYLTGANERDLYLYPGTKDVCRAIFVTYGTRIDPITVVQGETIDLNQYVPERNGYNFDGWALPDGTLVSGVYQLNETTTFVAQWTPDYVPFEAILRIENANDNGMTQATILGTWYAKAGSKIKVKSTYTGAGDTRVGTHTVVCVLDGEEYPVYKDARLKTEATLNDVYATYFLYNNTGTAWTDAVNWDDVYTGGELPYSTRPISSAGDTIINFDYMRVRNDIVFTIPNSDSSGGYIDVYKLHKNGLILGSVIYTGTTPTAEGNNVSAKGISIDNISWSYRAASRDSDNNLYTLHNMKYGQRIFEVYPVGGSWITARGEAFHQYGVSSNQRFSSRRQDLTSDFFQGSGRGVKPYSLTAEFIEQEFIALMYVIECLEGETPDFIYNGIGYKVDTELCEVVKHTGYFGIKDLEGCKAGVNMLGQYNSNNKYYTANDTNNYSSKANTVVGDKNVGNPTAEKLFGEIYWSYYSRYNGVSNLKTFAKMYIFRYDRIKMNIQFNFGYDADGNGSTETVKYDNIAYGEKIAEYQYGMADYQQHQLLNRDGYEFAGWYDANGFVLEAEDWDSMIATGDSSNNTMIFIAKWEKISNNIVEYYEDRLSEEPFEQHYFDDSELVPYPTMVVYPDGWVWQQYGQDQYIRFDWDVPMYGEYGVQETRTINGEEMVVNVIRIYETWDESHTRVIYLPNEAAGGVPGTAPMDYNEYTIWQSAVPVASRGDTANYDPEMIFVGWKLDRNEVVYQPGDHVAVQWPRTMVFTAQWAKADEVVQLLYDPNGGTPEDRYPNDTGFLYKKKSTASVWRNETTDNQQWFTRTGYNFKGWNTLPDGSGTSYMPESTILLTEPLTVLYAQWEKEVYDLSVYKTDSVSGTPLNGAEFGLYKLSGGKYLSVQSFTTGDDGHITFQNLEVDTVYKLMEEKAPDGYAIITKDILFGLKPDDRTNTVSLVFYDQLGNIVSAPEGVTGKYLSAGRLLTFTVKNLRGYELPATGGMGGIIYILFGAALVTAPFVYIFSLRRKYERRLKQ